MWSSNSKYNFFSFVGDCIMVIITCYLWFIWIIIREIQRSHKGRPTYGYPPQPQQRREVIEYRYYE